MGGRLRRLLLGLSAIALVSGCMGLQPRAYRDAAWGMSVSEVKKTEEGQGTEMPGPDLLSELRYRLEQDGYASDLSYGFMEDQLVYANSEYDTKEDQTDFADMKREQLTKKHKKPVQSMNEDWIRYDKWEDGDTVIILLTVSTDERVQIMFVQSDFYDANKFAFDGFLDVEG